MESYIVWALRLVSFAWHCIFKIYPRCRIIYQYVIPFYEWIIFHCINVPHFVYPFVCCSGCFHHLANYTYFWGEKGLPCSGFCNRQQQFPSAAVKVELRTWWLCLPVRMGRWLETWSWAAGSSHRECLCVLESDILVWITVLPLDELA